MIAAAIGVAVAALAIAGAWHAYRREPFDVEITRHEVVCRDLPPALDGFTICQVSDLHISAKGRNADAIADAIRSVDADLFVLTGDMIIMPSGIPAFFRWLDALGGAIRPVLAVRGNAEHKPYIDRQAVLQGFAERGIPVLNNLDFRFPYCGAELQIVGVDDPHTLHSDFPRAFAGADPNVWTLLLCHSPDGAVELAIAAAQGSHPRGCGPRADLMLCGHTHGGQIRFPLLGALKHGTGRLRGLVAGWYTPEQIARRARGPVRGTRMYVSRGLGMNRFPCRFLCRPELALFTLRAVERPRG